VAALGAVAVSLGCAGAAGVEAHVAPTSTLPANPLEAALRALGEVESFQIDETALLAVPGVSTGVVATQTSSYVYRAGPPAEFRIVKSFSDGISEETVCIDGKCWARTGDHPWAPAVEEHGPLQLRQLAFDARVLVNTVPLAPSGDVLVEWHRELNGSILALEKARLIGQTLLQADTWLPMREVVEVEDAHGALAWYQETVYAYEPVPPFTAPEAGLLEPVPRPDATSVPAMRTNTRDIFLPGALYVPRGRGPWPAVLVLHGSEGGIQHTGRVAQTFAEAGFVALAYCYSGCAGTPELIQNISVDGVMEALDYLRQRSDVRPDAVALLGYSRGAELALIVAALDPDARAVVAVSGSPWVAVGYPIGGVAWRRAGNPLDFYLTPVEWIDGPVLLIHGQHDQIVPVRRSYHVADRLAKRGHDYELIVYPGAGHIRTEDPDTIWHALAFLQTAFGLPLHRPDPNLVDPDASGPDWADAIGLGRVSVVPTAQAGAPTIP
jgi:dienelactone hydrolase